MRCRLRHFAIALTFLPFIAAPALSQDKSDEHSARPAGNAGPEHQELARLAGEYNTVTKFSMQPGAEPSTSRGTAKLTSVLDGQFLLEESAGTQFGRPIRGLRLIGYNTAAKQYEACWTYTMSNAIMTMTGTSAGEGKPIEWKASYATQKGSQTLSIVTRIVDADNFVVEMISKAPDGKKGPTLETTYTRKK
jgi:hypothetical protein